MGIEAHRQAVIELPLDVAVLAGLRHTAKLLSTHFSTQIEGNRLTRAQVEEAIAGARFPARERDEREVRNYYRAVEEVEALAGRPGPIQEVQARRIHGLVMTGRARATPYRDGQNVIRDASAGEIVYMPPEAPEVPSLMAELIAWINGALADRELPAPIVAAIAHCQYATIHPYYDGNGRTARLLATLILHKSGYGLKGIYALEEHYARDLRAYHRALSIGPSHNYHFGRAESPMTGFVEYFCLGMERSLSAIRAHAVDAARRGASDGSPLLRALDPRQRRVLELFHDRGSATSAELATHLRLSPRTVSALCRAWTKAGFLAVHDPSRKRRTYRLGDEYERIAVARNAR